MTKQPSNTNGDYPANVVRIRGITYDIREIWYSVQHPEGPPVVVVQRPWSKRGAP